MNFNDTPDDEYIYVDAAKLRKEYKAGAKAIQEYEDQLKRSRDAEAPPSQSQAKAKRSKGMAAAKAMLMVENGKRGGKKRKQAQPKFDDAIEELGTNSESFQSQPPEPVMAPKRHKRGRVVEEESDGTNAWAELEGGVSVSSAQPQEPPAEPDRMMTVQPRVGPYLQSSYHVFVHLCSIAIIPIPWSGSCS